MTAKLSALFVRDLERTEKGKTAHILGIMELFYYNESIT